MQYKYKEETKMKPKTFTYNQIVQFFIENKLPLSRDQMNLIASKIRIEIDQLEQYKERKEEQKAKRDLKRLKRKEVRKELGYSRIGLNNV